LLHIWVITSYLDFKPIEVLWGRVVAPTPNCQQCWRTNGQLCCGFSLPPCLAWEVPPVATQSPVELWWIIEIHKPCHHFSGFCNS
jgi:hypothetical protein